MTITVGLAGMRGHACVALGDSSGLRTVCQQERVTRVRNAGFNATGLPDEALDLLLRRVGCTRADVARYVLAGSASPAGPAAAESLDEHAAHAATAYLTSPFSSAAIVVCDRSRPAVSVWLGEGTEIRRVDWPWHGPGFADVYARCAEILGFGSGGGGQRMEALARLRPDHRDARVDAVLSFGGESIERADGWEATLSGLVGSLHHECMETTGARWAAAFQGRITDLVLEFLAAVRRTTGQTNLCLGGGLFYHSAINTAVRRATVFEHVFVPVDPGDAGMAVGATLSALRMRHGDAGPFLGPEYASDEVKQTLDNCKLRYDWVSEDGAIDAAVDALLKGTLVAWFDGPMEWGPRTLGARCILANPFSPYVLENLNRFLKQREPWRGYALSGLSAAVHEHFDGPEDARFMECDYRPKDASRFTHVLPTPCTALRVHTVGPGAPPRFRALLEAFGAASGLPFLVNTSFNGFQEPIVCSPRDAVRIFYGTGLDLLVFRQFLLSK